MAAKDSRNDSRNPYNMKKHWKETYAGKTQPETYFPDKMILQVERIVQPLIDDRKVMQQMFGLLNAISVEQVNSKNDIRSFMVSEFQNFRSHVGHDLREVKAEISSYKKRFDDMARYI